MRAIYYSVLLNISFEKMMFIKPLIRKNKNNKINSIVWKTN